MPIIVGALGWVSRCKEQTDRLLLSLLKWLFCWSTDLSHVGVIAENACAEQASYCLLGMHYEGGQSMMLDLWMMICNYSYVSPMASSAFMLIMNTALWKNRMLYSVHVSRMDPFLIMQTFKPLTKDEIAIDLQILWYKLCMCKWYTWYIQ